MKRLAIVLAIVVALGGCAGGPDAITLCDSYAATLKILAAHRAAGDLSPGQVATVDRLRPRANAICSGDMPTSDILIDELDAILLEFIIINQGVSQ